MANDFIKSYFGFNKQQRNGLYALILISFFLLIARLLYPVFISPGKIVVQNLLLIERKLDSSFAVKKKWNAENYHQEKKDLRLFIFDPNKVSQEQLIQLGFSEKRATTFLKFRNRGFRFKKKEDLQKVYGISGNFYKTLEPYILIGEKEEKPMTGIIEKNEVKEISKQKKEVILIELNSADSSALESLNGIGAGYTKRILKYKSVLGGYVNVEQLKEVYGFTNELFEKIKPLVTIDASQVKKINLNKDDFKTLNKHPYLSYELTKNIFNFRRTTLITRGNLIEVLNDNSLCQKLLPYLAFD